MFTKVEIGVEGQIRSMRITNYIHEIIKQQGFTVLYRQSYSMSCNDM